MIRLPLAATRLDEQNTRSRVTIHSDPCPPNTQLARIMQFDLLRMMSQDPALTQCGGSDFQTLSMVHDGGKWIVVLEAIHPTT